MAKVKYRVLRGINDGRHRGDPGDVVAWIPEDAVDGLQARGVIEEYQGEDQ